MCAAMAEEEEEEVAQRRLNESTLWKEDVLASGHSSVWGSWYDSKAKSWGYACCRSLHRDRPCTTVEAAEPGAASGEDASSSDGEAGRLAKMEEANKPFERGDLPAELLPRESVGGGDPAAFIDHFVRFCIGAWRREHAAGFQGFGDMERAAFQGSSLQTTERAITPLLRRLKRGESLERGEKEEWHGTCRETRTSMDGQLVLETSVLDQIHHIVTMAVERQYTEAHAAYIKLTLGNKKWNSTTVMHIPACQMKGAREYRRNRDSLNTYDVDPVSQKYMHALRKLVQLAQCIRPNDDQSKNVLL